MFSAGLSGRTRIIASSSVCQEFRNHLFGNGSTSYVQIRTATKRGAGSSKNGRDSAGKRLGIKVVTGEYVIPGNVLVRQRGQKFHPGQAVSIGRDHTLMANEPGYVYYYEHHIPFPHQQTSKLQPPESSYISKPGSIDNGLRAVRQSMKEKDFAPVKFPRGLKRYVGIVRHKHEILPRDQRDQGRERRFWKLSEPEVFKPF